MAIESGRTSVDELLQDVDLPNPVTRVPFEKFSSLYQNDDMLVRAAFWCFYAAWLADARGKDTPASHAVEARHDGHMLRAITQELSVRDMVLIRRDHLTLYRAAYEDSLYRASGVWVWLYMTAWTVLVAGVTFLWATGAFRVL